MVTNTYEVIADVLNSTIIKKTDPSGVISWVPTDPTNFDYQMYLAQVTP